MVDILTAFLAGTAATLVPLYVGIAAPRVIRVRWETWPILLAAGASGILFWFFLDVMGDATLLDSISGFSVAYPDVAVHIALVVLFALGLVFLFWLEKDLRRHIEGSASPSSPTTESISSNTHLLVYGIAITAALGIGFHALGEGVAIGAVIPGSAGILDAIGGLSAGTAYVLHKLLEGLVVGIFAVLANSTSWRKLGILGLVSGLPTILGFFVGVVGPIPAPYFFAIGGAGAVYAETRLVPLFAKRDIKYSSIIFLLLGFYAMYIAGLFHSAGG